MKLDKVHPEIRRWARWIPSIPFHIPVVRMLVNVLVKLVPGFKGDSNIKVSWVDHGQSRSKIYRPVAPKSDGVLLWIHGGGYICLDSNLDYATCCRIVETLGITVVSVDYRLASVKPFPAALDDCVASWQWLQQHATTLGVNPQRAVIAGESAGGGLTAALAQRLHDEGGQQPVAQLIFAPMLDDRTALREDLTAEKHFLWNNKNNRGGWQSYLGQEPGLPEVPQYSVPARRESLVGLPQAWLGIGDIDLFYEESVAYAERLEADGVSCELFITEGGPHACETALPQSSPGQAWWNSVFAFLRRVLE